MADDDRIRLEPSWKTRIGDYLQREDIAAVLGEIDTLERLCADLLAGESVAEGAT